MSVLQWLAPGNTWTSNLQGKLYSRTDAVRRWSRTNFNWKSRNLHAWSISEVLGIILAVRRWREPYLSDRTVPSNVPTDCMQSSSPVLRSRFPENWIRKGGRSTCVVVVESAMQSSKLKRIVEHNVVTTLLYQILKPLFSSSKIQNALMGKRLSFTVGFNSQTLSKSLVISISLK